MSKDIQLHDLEIHKMNKTEKMKTWQGSTKSEKPNTYECNGWGQWKVNFAQNLNWSVQRGYYFALFIDVGIIWYGSKCNGTLIILHHIST